MPTRCRDCRRAEFAEKWVKAVAKDFAEHAGKSLIVVGPRQPAWVHALAHAVNDALGNYAAGMAEFRDAPPELLDKSSRTGRGHGRGEGQHAARRRRQPGVQRARPTCASRDELQKVAKKIRLGLFLDHTSEKCDWHLPLAHFLESWGDAEAADGSLCCVQPLIAPLNSGKVSSDDVDPPARGGRTVLEVLALLTQFTGRRTTSRSRRSSRRRRPAYDYVRKAFSDRERHRAHGPDVRHRVQPLQATRLPPDRRGQGEGTRLRKPDEKARTPKPASAARSRWPRSRLSPAADQGRARSHLPPGYALHDGRFAMNPWLQELPDPITKLVWDNAALISPATAAEFGMKQGDVVEATASATAAIDVPVFVLPGQADWSVALAFGQYGDMRIAPRPAGRRHERVPAAHARLRCTPRPAAR